MFYTLTLHDTKYKMLAISCSFFLHGASTRNKNGTTDKLKAIQSYYCFSILSPKTSTSFFVWRIIFQTTKRSRVLCSPGKCQMGSSQQQKKYNDGNLLSWSCFHFTRHRQKASTISKQSAEPSNHSNRFSPFNTSTTTARLRQN